MSKNRQNVYNIQVMVTEGIYDFAVKADTLEEALTKGKEIAGKKCSTGLALENKLECMDETMEVTGVYRIETQ